jgi:magnesium transporter
MEQAASPPVQRSAHIEVITYTADDCSSESMTDVAQLQAVADKNDDRIAWINVEGDIGTETLQKIGAIFKLHPMEMEDVLSPQETAKVDNYEDHCLVVARMVSLGERVSTEQLCILFSKKFILTFERGKLGNCFDEARRRLEKNINNTRKLGADGVAYSLLDAVIKGYSPVLETLGDRLEELETEIMQGKKETHAKVLAVKREIHLVRRNLSHIRDAIDALYRSSEFVDQATGYYLRDCLDHSNRLTELAQTYHELCTDLDSLYLAAVGNRMNEVMKLLTIITTLFIPPSLITGIYGMNFQHQPELQWVYGYPFALVLMLVLTLVIFGWMKRRGLF